MLACPSVGLPQGKNSNQSKLLRQALNKKGIREGNSKKDHSSNKKTNVLL